MDTQAFDIVVIGAGIAGSTAAAQLSPYRRVALIEAEEQAGYHTTGRSAAMWLQNYGPPDVRELSRLSRDFFVTPPTGFTGVPLMRHRPMLFLAAAHEMDALEEELAGGIGLRRVDLDEAARMQPALRPGYAAGAAVEDDAFDMDVSAIHQGFLRMLRSNGGVVGLRHRAGRIERSGGEWAVETSAGGMFRAPVLVNAAGAWGDDVATIAGVAPIGLRPCRRTACIINPAPHDVENWPMTLSAGHQWYARPEARARLLVSPEDETPMHPHDVQPEEIDIALGIDRMQQALAIEVQRVERAWAGLRTFAPDGSLAVGWDRTAEGFFWSVGQGGYGIQTSPAAGKLVMDMVLGRDPGEAGAILPIVDPARF
ncbi:MAG: NAD(P)/FAD-dependent oxidoreductase [Acetobacteraceae bacterium]